MSRFPFAGWSRADAINPRYGPNSVGVSAADNFLTTQKGNKISVMFVGEEKIRAKQNVATIDNVSLEVRCPPVGARSACCRQRAVALCALYGLGEFASLAHSPSATDFVCVRRARTWPSPATRAPSRWSLR